MFQFFGTGLLEAEDFASLRINPGHDMPYGAIFTCGVHALEYNQERMAVGCVVKLLQAAEIPHMAIKQLLIVPLRFGECRYGCGPLAQFELLVRWHAVGF